MRTIAKTLKRWARTLVFGPLPDRLYVAVRYWLTFHRSLNLNSPETFNEKMQWLKLFGNTEQYADLADKYKVREYVSAKIGAEYLNELFGVYNTPSEINYGQLPNEFILKATHGSQMNIIWRDKNKLEIEAVNRQLRQWLGVNYYKNYREPVYKNIRPRIVCERLLEGKEGKELWDYRFFCFHGRVQFIQVTVEPNLKHYIYDRDWRPCRFSYSHPTSPGSVDEPEELGRMIEMAERLAEGMIFVRVDLYYVNSKIVFGELTFYPNAGFRKFSPFEWDYRVGTYLRLPESIRNKN